MKALYIGWIIVAIIVVGGVAYVFLGGQAPSATPTSTATTTTTAGGVTPPAHGQSGVRGSIALGPTCPVMRNPPDPQCADKPYETTVVARDASGTIVATGASLTDGTFSLALAPGSYTLTAGGSKMLPRCAPITIEVPLSGYVATTISCDTGIR